MKSLVSYFDCGKVFIRSNKVVVDFVVTKISDLVEKVIPFFDKYKIVGIKAENFERFKQIAALIENKAHLTSKGLEEIRKIQTGMNKEKSNFS